jgi:hypothetical protein
MLADIGVSRWEIDGIIGSPNRDASGRARQAEVRLSNSKVHSRAHCHE